LFALIAFERGTPNSTLFVKLMHETAAKITEANSLTLAEIGLQNIQKLADL
jgi:hypothetical protein